MSNSKTNPVLWTSADAAAATGGTALGEWSISGLSIDTRTLEEGDLFVPLKDVRDGHDFINAAMAAGAGATLTERDDTDAPALKVTDAIKALRDLGTTACMRSGAKRIAITGSVGKTSVKEAAALMFAAFGQTHKSVKSYNNHWGVPLTMARMPEASEYGIFELGMNHAGELADLSRLLKPSIALITTVVGAHLAHFDSVKDIAKAKAEIMEGLSADGILILNADNPHTPFIADMAKTAGKTVLTYGHDDTCDVVIVTAKSHVAGSNTRLRINSQQIDVTLQIPGDHWISNGAACMALAYAAGLDLRKAARALRDVAAQAGRGQVSEVQIDAARKIMLIDDSYNANPASMEAAIKTLGLSSGRRLAVLGDMFELGKNELDFHAGLAKPLEEHGVSRVITVGECMRALKGAIPQSMRGAWAKDWDNALSALMDELQGGDTVLVKGSNGMKLGQLVKEIKSRGQN
ncbi:MAG: UDP-N-acetylmuramoyl-tripeptide--D-alanyl-D-alanine ligase [Maricaulaceae bacterium]